MISRETSFSLTEEKLGDGNPALAPKATLEASRIFSGSLRVSLFATDLYNGLSGLTVMTSPVSFVVKQCRSVELMRLAGTMHPPLDGGTTAWSCEDPCLLLRRPAPTGTFLIAPPAVQYLWQLLQKCLGWLTL
uniref:Uncharacterized protein n=1 Tax=Opuntia streptacantha TaxID=393608 RepID=A0A7C8Z1L7_OPUST